MTDQQKTLKSSAKAKYHVPALETGLDVLETLAASDHSMSLKELADAVDKPTGSLFRIIHTLEQRGYVGKEEHSGNYQLLLKLYGLATQHPPLKVLVSRSSPAMLDLARLTGHSCHLSVLDGGALRILHETSMPQNIRVLVNVGGLYPILTTPSGRLLLAFEDTSVRDTLLGSDGHFAAMTSRERLAFLDHLDEIRTRGWESADSEVYQGVRDFCAPIGTTESGLLASLSITALTDAGEQTAAAPLVAALLAAAKQITSNIGGNDGD